MSIDELKKVKDADELRAIPSSGQVISTTRTLRALLLLVIVTFGVVGLGDGSRSRPSPVSPRG